MTDEEVQSIYEYLHENYEYRDGELLLTGKNKNYKKNHLLGTVSIPDPSKGYAHLMTYLNVDGNVYSMPLSHAIFIYHKKRKPEYILFANKNRMDNRIENLQESTWQDVINSRDYDACQGFKYANGRHRVCIRAADYEGSLGAYKDALTAKEIYLLAKGLLKSGPLSIQELREKLPLLHPEAKPPHKVKRILPFAYLNKQNKYDSKMTYKSVHSIYFGTFDTALDAHYAAMDFKQKIKEDPSILESYKNKMTTKSGVRNVYESNKSIFAKITIKKKTYTLGPFETKESAYDAQKKAKETGVFDVYDGNRIIQKSCSLCDVMVEIKQKNDHMKKYCPSCKKEQMRLIDKGRYPKKSFPAQLSRDQWVYIFGYFPTKEEADAVRKQKANEYTLDKEQFIKSYSPARRAYEVSKRVQREKYIQHRLKRGLPVKEKTLMGH